MLKFKFKFKKGEKYLLSGPGSLNSHFEKAKVVICEGKETNNPKVAILVQVYAGTESLNDYHPFSSPLGLSAKYLHPLEKQKPVTLKDLVRKK